MSSTKTLSCTCFSTCTVTEETFREEMGQSKVFYMMIPVTSFVKWFLYFPCQQLLDSIEDMIG